MAAYHAGSARISSDEKQNVYSHFPFRNSSSGQKVTVLGSEVQQSSLLVSFALYIYIYITRLYCCSYFFIVKFHDSIEQLFFFIIIWNWVFFSMLYLCPFFVCFEFWEEVLMEQMDKKSVLSHIVSYWIMSPVSYYAIVLSGIISYPIKVLQCYIT